MKLSLASARTWTNLVLGRRQPLNDGQRRYTRLFQSAVSALAGKGIGIVISIIAVPLTVNYLGAERYGVWIAISTLLAWLTLADLGLGNGLTNALSEAYGKNRPDLAQAYVATAIWMLIGITVALGSLGILVWPLIDWSGVFNVRSAQAKAEVAPAVALALSIFLLSFPLSLVSKIYGAYQEGATANYWAALGNVASFLSLIIVTNMHGNLVLLVLAVSGSTFLVNFFSAIWLFFWHKPWVMPKISAFDRSIWRGLFQTGIEFFVLQIAALVLFQSDNLVIAYFLGPEHVTSYNILYRLFHYPVIMLSVFLAPLWPAYAEAASRNDWAWITETFKKVYPSTMFIFISITAIITLFSDQIINVWIGSNHDLNVILTTLMALWTIMAASGNCFTFLQNGLGRIRIQSTVACFMAICNLILSIIWVQKFGLTGVIGATVVSYAVTSLWVAPLDTYLFLRKQLGRDDVTHEN